MKEKIIKSSSGSSTTLQFWLKESLTEDENNDVIKSATHLSCSNKESEWNRVSQMLSIAKNEGYHLCAVCVHLRVSSFLTHIRFILNRFNPEIHKHMKIIKSVDIEGKHALSRRRRRRRRSSNE